METSAQRPAQPEGASPESQGSRSRHVSDARNSGGHRSHRRHHRARHSRRSVLRLLAGQAKVIAVELAVAAVITYLIILYLNSANAPAIP